MTGQEWKRRRKAQGPLRTEEREGERGAGGSGKWVGGPAAHENNGAQNDGSMSSGRCKELVRSQCTLRAGTRVVRVHLRLPPRAATVGRAVAVKPSHMSYGSPHAADTLK